MTRTVVLDSDALIKLGKAGLLGTVAKAWRCLVPEEVYTETVVRGLQEAHPDAEAIAALFGRALIRRRVRRKRTSPRLGRGLGAGERAAVALFLQARADFIVTDDRAFLRALREAGLPYATSALVVVELARSGAMTLQDAAAGFERLRPVIRQDQYEAALADLAALAGQEGG
jgi:predicted nucleic acid-binding protein